MTLNQPGIYHIYNRGNNQQMIFFTPENYIYFLKKCHKYIKPYCDVLAWCLMPNHFHFLTYISEKSLTPVKSGGIIMPVITNGFRLLQSSYAKGINKQFNRSGNLFQQKTKSKLVNGEDNYAITAFHYIHQNPVAASLAKMPEEWEYSSYRDYTGVRNGTLCDKQKAITLLSLSQIDLTRETMAAISNEKVKELY